MASAAFSVGNAKFVDEDFDGALEEYNKAIQLDASNAEYFSKRAATHLKLEMFTDAIADANSAIKLDSNNANAYLRKGVALFNLDEFESSYSALLKASEIDSSNSQIKSWLAKATAKLQAEGKLPAAPAAAAPSSSPSVPAPSVPAPTPAPAAAAAKVPALFASLPVPGKIRHDWYQSPSHAVVTIYAKGVQKSDMQVDIQERHLLASVKTSNSNEYTLDLDLFDAIIPAESKYELMSTKIEIHLRKSRPITWTSLDAPQEAPAAYIPAPDASASAASSSAAVQAKPSYPSSSKKKHDWDSLNRSIEEDFKKEKPEGDQALNALLQQIYSQGSDEQKRAMMKSFTESGGTVLSTNWDEVGKKKVEVSPPSGMEARQWSK